jgi:multiple RNA-binding domain-containing protein 1
MERKKQEFIEVMMGGKKNSSNSFWANDDGQGERSKSVETKEPIESLDKDDPVPASDSESESSASDSDDDSVDVMNTFKKEVSDMDFLRSKVLSDKADLSDDDDDDDDDSDNDADNVNDNESDKGDEKDSSGSDSDSSSAPSESDNDEEAENSYKSKDIPTKDYVGANPKPIVDSGDQSTPIANARLFVRNLPFSATEDEIRETFTPYGEIVECHIPVDDTNRNKGYAFVKFSSDSEASNAMENLDGMPFQGRLVHIIPAREERNNADPEYGEDPMDMNHKMKKELERQKDATTNTAGWNASFIRGDVVVDNLSSRLGLEKGKILDVKDGLSSGNAAVRLALGETQVIEENKKYFENQGFDITTLESTKSSAAAKRSSNVILVKNLPFDTSHDELAKIFIAVGGKEPQVLLPPSRTIALVIYESNNDAKRAFRKVAYKRFKHVPLYLEWASIKSTEKKVKSEDKQSVLNSKEEDAVEESIDEGESTTIYVKNLNFRTTEESLLRVFEEDVGNVRSVRIPTKVASVKSTRVGKGLNEKSVRQSMGYGFVEFKSDASAKKALSLLQGKAIDGHNIDLKISKQGNPTEKLIGGKKKPSTKIIVRNVPFQASRTEILQLFGSFGQLKTVRLPKKFDGGHRGFAFVEFTVAKEALNAMKALSSTHLYGRHLILEWADDKGDVDTLRTKAKRDSTTVAAVKNKKIRFE